MKTLLITFALLLQTTVAFATTRYVDGSLGADCTSGNYSIASRNCTGSDGNAWNTIAEGVSPTVAGDTLYIRAGTYSVTLNINNKNGSDGSYITIARYQSETVTLRATSGNDPIAQGTYSYIIIDGLIFDGINTGAVVPPSPSSAVTGYWRIGPTDHHLIVKNSEFKEQYVHAVLIGNGSSTKPHDITFQNNTLHDLRSDQYPACTDGWRGYAFYIAQGDNIVIENNHIYNTNGGAIQIYPGPLTNVVIRKNKIHDAFQCSTNFNGAILNGNGSSTNVGTQIYDNYIYHNQSPGPTPHGIKVYNSASGTKIWNNIIYDNSGTSTTYGVLVEANATGTVIQNNIIFGNKTGSISNSAGAQTTITNNACPTADSSCGTVGSNAKVDLSAITGCTVSTTDFTHKSGSVCGGAGTAVSSRSTPNGAGPDIGAHELMVHSTCSVEDGDASNLRITYSNNAFPPVLPATAITGITVRKAGANDAVVGGVCARVGTNRVDCPLTDAIVNGNTVDYSYSQTGNLTDSALIGNGADGAGVNQELLAITNQSCTNNVGAAASHLFIQAAYEWHGLHGTEDAPVMLRTAAGVTENLPIHPVPGGKARLRISVTCSTADCPPTGFFPYYSCASCASSGTYTLLTDDFAADEDVKFCGADGDLDIPTSGTATTDQLSTSGVFVAGALVRTSNAIPTIDLDNDPASKTELEYCIAWDADVVADRAYNFRVYQQDGTALDTYTVTPQATIAPMSLGVGF